MPYDIRELETPEEVDTNKRFEIVANVCCVDGDDDNPVMEDPCDPADLELKVYRMVRGPMGMWDFPLINDLLKRDEQVLLSQEVEFGNCTNFQDRPRLDTPGQYKAVITVGDQKATQTFEVEAN